MFHFISKLFQSNSQPLIPQQSNNNDLNDNLAKKYKSLPTIDDVTIIDEIKELIKQYDLDNYLDALLEQIKSEIIIRLDKEGRGKIGSSRLGGYPDLPMGMDWPKGDWNRPLSFVAQINLEELRDIYIDINFPRYGILYFFAEYGNEDFGTKKSHSKKFRVIYTNDPKNTSPFYPNSNQDRHFQIFKEYSVNFQTKHGLPSSSSDFIFNLFAEKHNDHNRYELMVPRGENNHHKMFGHPSVLQSDIEEICEAIYRGYDYDNDLLWRSFNYRDKYNQELVNSIESEAKNWILLLQVDSDPRLNINWSGNSGRIFYCIRRRDLEKGNFSHVWCVQQPLFY